MTRVEGKRHGIRSRKNGLGQKNHSKNNLTVLAMAKVVHQVVYQEKKENKTK